MFARFLPLLLFLWYPASADYVCVCSNHIGAHIYATPNTHQQPIGILYPDAGECKPAFNDTSHPQFVALVHYHQIGYVELDKDVEITNCAGHPNIDDTVSTTPIKSTTPPQTTPSQSTPSQTNTSQSTPTQTIQTNSSSPSNSPPKTTIPQASLSRTAPPQTTPLSSTPLRTIPTQTTPLQTTPLHTTQSKNSLNPASSYTLTTPFSPTGRPKGCNKLALFMDIALGKNMGTAASRHCADNVHYDADAVVSAFCSAPDSIRWLKGRKVVDYAGVIQKYSPLGTFTSNNRYKGSAGIYLGYINSTLYIATQSCSSVLDILKVTATSAPKMDEYFEIIW